MSKKPQIKKKISRRDFIEKSSIAAGGIGLGLLGSTFFGCSSVEQSPPPNILIMVADDAGWRDVGYHDSEIKTPNIDRLAKTGVELDQFYVYPTCSPTRASLLTGRYASRFGIAGPIAMKSKQVLPSDTVTLPELLRKRGYSTAITGKWHLGLRPESGPRQYGFDHTYGFLHGQIDQYTHKYKNGDQSWHRNDKFISEEGHATDLITNEATNYIKHLRDKSKPFFLYVPFSVPHYPLQEDEKWLSKYQSIENESRRTYAASVAHLDDSVGEIIKTLEDENLRENTLVIFLSDNGAQENWTPTFEYEMRHGPYDRLGDNGPLRDWKTSLYEGGIRVPALINWPSKLSSRKEKQLLQISDILPTIASLTGAEINSNMKLDGSDIWQTLIKGKNIGERPLYLRTAKQAILRRGDWKLIHNGASLDEGAEELYNIADDPYEKVNLIDRNSSIADNLRIELKQQFENDYI